MESRSRVDSLLRLIAGLDFEIDTFAGLVAGRLRSDPGFRAIQQIPGVGPLLGAVFVAEIGDITRFHRPAQLASGAGLTPTHRESDTTVHRGRITKKGSRLVRWAAVEAVPRRFKKCRKAAERCTRSVAVRRCSRRRGHPCDVFAVS